MARDLQKVCDLYHQAACTPSDMFEHVPTLMRFGRMVEHITEFGTRTGVSTAAFLRAEPAKLITYDVFRQPDVDFLEDAARAAEIPFQFVQADVLTIDIEETDLLFIDTKHTFIQLAGELRRHVPKVRKFVVVHDTVTFGRRGEVAGDPGLLQALEVYFTARLRTWKLIDHFQNCNGLSVYMKRDGK